MMPWLSFNSHRMWTSNFKRSGLGTRVISSIHQVIASLPPSAPSSFTLTSFEQVIWFPMKDTDRPPRRLGLFRVDTLCYSRNHLASIVWEMHLLPRLDEFNVGLGDGSTVQLLKVFKGLFVVSAK